MWDMYYHTGLNASIIAHFVKLTMSCGVQAVKAVSDFNGTELAGRKILVREDREDRDVKAYNRDNNIEQAERPERPPRRERRPREPRGPPDGEERSDNRQSTSNSSGLKVPPFPYLEAT